MINVSYSEARKSFAGIWDSVVKDREPALIHRRGTEDIAILPADELMGLLEIAHLFSSGANAKKLTDALDSALNQKSKPQSIDSLKTEFGL